MASDHIDDDVHMHTTLVPFHREHASCSCVPQRLAGIVSPEEVQEMALWFDCFQRPPVLPWWTSLVLVVVFVVCLSTAAALLKSWYPLPLVLLAAALAVTGLAVLVDNSLDYRHAKKNCRRVLDELEGLNRDWRVRRSFQLVLTSVEQRGRFAIELGARHRAHPLDELILRKGVTRDIRFSPAYSLAVEELCGAEYAATQFAIDVESLNSVPAVRWATAAFALNIAAPFLVVSLYYLPVWLFSSLGLLDFSAAVSLPAILTVFACMLVSIPLVSHFRRRATAVFLRQLSYAVNQLQMRRGSGAGAWRWEFREPEDMDRRTERPDACHRRTARILDCLDLCFHVGPDYSVHIVSAQRAARDHTAELEALP
jgi:hypothetical protein